MADLTDGVGSESLAKSRDQRKNAGNKMSKLLADELGDDEFYKTALGGFAEESGDEEYVSEAEVSDQVDSDFSMSETDEVIEQDEDDEGKKKRKKSFIKKPSRAKVEDRAPSSKVVEKTTKETKMKKDKSYELRETRRKSTRASTMQSSDKHRKRMEGKKVELRLFILEFAPVLASGSSVHLHYFFLFNNKCDGLSLIATYTVWWNFCHGCGVHSMQITTPNNDT